MYRVFDGISTCKCLLFQTEVNSHGTRGSSPGWTFSVHVKTVIREGGCVHETSAGSVRLKIKIRKGSWMWNDLVVNWITWGTSL